MVLTDAERRVLVALRTVGNGEGGEEEVRVGGVYRLEGRQNVVGVPEMTRARVAAVPRKKLRRGIDFLVTGNIACSPQLERHALDDAENDG